jgi:hypothetical protein
VIVRIDDGLISRRVSARVVDTLPIYGPDHLAAGLDNGRVLIAATVPRAGYARSEVFVLDSVALMPPESDSEPERPADGFFPISWIPGQFGTYSFATRMFSTGRGPGDIDWARAVHQHDVFTSSDLLLPGTTEEVILRIVGDRGPPREPDVRVLSKGEELPDPEPQPTEMTISSFLTCEKQSGMRGPALVRGRILRVLYPGELEASFEKQTPLPNRWTFQTSPVEQNPVPGCFEFALPTTLKDPQDGEQVQVVFEAFDCSKTIFAGCRQLSVRQVYRASVE